MNSRPILFSDPMVRAILAGKKTQTRRIAKHWVDDTCACPYGKPGDELWVREAWVPGRNCLRFFYRATDAEKLMPCKWRPSIHMPRAACRLRLTIEATRVERLQAITEADAIAEGIYDSSFRGQPIIARDEYASLWDTINGAGAWGQNPLVWVITFARKESA